MCIPLTQPSAHLWVKCLSSEAHGCQLHLAKHQGERIGAGAAVKVLACIITSLMTDLGWRRVLSANDPAIITVTGTLCGMVSHPAAY